MNCQLIVLTCALVLVAGAFAEKAPKVCTGYKEHYEECGTACPAVCHDSQTPPAGGCMTLCVKGCFCDAGLVRDVKRTGLCMKPYMCNAKMPVNFVKLFGY